MDLAWRYSVVVQVISRNGRDVFYGSCPDFGIEIYEVVDPGNQTQEYMFSLKMRRQIGESLSVHKAENKEPPMIRPASSLTYATHGDEFSESCGPAEMVQTSVAAKMLTVHAETIRRLFDSGMLTGAISSGGQRLISVKSINDEKLR